MPKTSKILLFFIFFFLVSPGPALAAKKRVWSTQSIKVATTATRPSFSVRFRSDRQALNINFYNLNTASATSYELTYQGNGLDQGVVGTINTTESASANRLLLFGTCSKNVCTYHKNIQNMQLTITSKLNSGKTLIKRYKIKV